MGYPYKSRKQNKTESRNWLLCKFTLNKRGHGNSTRKTVFTEMVLKSGYTAVDRSRPVHHDQNHPGKKWGADLKHPTGEGSVQIFPECLPLNNKRNNLNSKNNFENSAGLQI